MDEPRLGVAAAARRLGIAPATLRTWDRRYDLGPTGHAPGRHRRYSVEDIARLELMQHALVRGASPADAARYARTAPLPSPESDPATPPPEAGSASRGDPYVDDGRDDSSLPVDDTDDSDDSDDRGDRGDSDGAEPRAHFGGRTLRLSRAGRRARGLGRAALALDAGVVRMVLGESIAACGVVCTWDEVVRPVLTAVADRWEHTGSGVEVEHLLSDCVSNVFGSHAAALRPVGAIRPVLLAALPGEHHVLPMVALSAALADQGVASRSLGADLPVEALVAAVRRTAPAAVVLWSQLCEVADVGVLGALPRTRLRFRTYAAGPGWADAELPPRIARLDSLASATEAISGVVLV